MVDVQIHIVHAEILQAFVEHFCDVLLTGHAVCDLVRCTRQEFRGDHDILTLCKIAQRTSDVLFARAGLVSDGSVEEIHAKLQSAPDDLA